MEKYKVKIHMQGVQLIDGEEDESIVNSVGECTKRDGDYYVIFKEEQEGQIIKTMIKIIDDYIEVVKRGAIESNMKFIQGKSHEFEYSTPFGDLNMGIKTESLRVFKEGDNFKIYIDYNLFTNEIFTAKCKMFMRIKRIDE